MPSDLQLELEYWAETGEFDEDELHEVSYSLSFDTACVCSVILTTNACIYVEEWHLLLKFFHLKHIGVDLLKHCKKGCSVVIG